jgi:hypothetical protein
MGAGSERRLTDRRKQFERIGQWFQTNERVYVW